MTPRDVRRQVPGLACGLRRCCACGRRCGRATAETFDPAALALRLRAAHALGHERWKALPALRRRGAAPGRWPPPGASCAVHRAVEIVGHPRYTEWTRSAEFFDAERYPVVAFVSRPYTRSCSGGGGALAGELSIRGITRPKSLTWRRPPARARRLTATWSRPAACAAATTAWIAGVGAERPGGVHPARRALKPERAAHEVRCARMLGCCRWRLLCGACVSLSDTQRDRARGDRPRRALAGHRLQRGRRLRRAVAPARRWATARMAESTPQAPRHYALMLDRGQDALLARINLIRSARSRIDLQTYIFDEDDAGALVLDELLAAARRGVQRARADRPAVGARDVRHPGRAGRRARQLPGAPLQPGASARRSSTISQYCRRLRAAGAASTSACTPSCCWSTARSASPAGATTRTTITTGMREYNFRDRDVLVAGPAARAMAANFDAFWNARRSVPVERLADVGRKLLKEGVPAHAAAGVPASRARGGDVGARPTTRRWCASAWSQPAMPVGAVQVHRRPAAEASPRTPPRRGRRRSPDCATLIESARSTRCCCRRPTWCCPSRPRSCSAACTSASRRRA